MLVNSWRPAPLRGVVRLSIPAPDLRLTVAGLAVAPGGTAIAYVASTTGEPQLMIRRVSEFDAKPVEAVRGALTRPAFSPDGASLAFFKDGQIRRVDLRGGPAIPICQVPGTLRGLSWRGSWLVFAADNVIYRVADTGGTPEVLARFDEGELVGLPQMLDDGGTLLYSLASGPELAAPTRRVILQKPSGTRTVVADNAVNPMYVAHGRVLLCATGRSWRLASTCERARSSEVRLRSLKASHGY